MNADVERGKRGGGVIEFFRAQGSGDMSDRSKIGM